MQIQTFSPLQGDGNYYLNSENFDSRFMWTDTVASINYIVCRLEGSTWKIISNGKLNGYNDGTVNYQYKFDFNNYIKIKQEKEPILYKESVGFYSYVTNTVCELSLVISTNDIFAVNTTKITTLSNGEMVLSGANTPATLTALISLDYIFHDSINGNIQLPSSQYFYTNSYIPFTVGAGKDVYITTYYSDGTTIYSHTGTSTINSKVFLFYIPMYCTRIEISGVNGNILTNTFIPLRSQCKNQLFYYGIGGNLDMIYVEGNSHEVNNITKDYININNQKLPINIKYQKQLKCNTGFRLDQSQIYSLIKTPYVFNKLNVTVPNEIDRNLLSNSQRFYQGMSTDNGTNISYINVDGQPVVNIDPIVNNGNAWVYHGITFKPGVQYTFSVNTITSTPFKILICGNEQLFPGYSSGIVSFTFYYISDSYNVIYVEIPDANWSTNFYNFKIEESNTASDWGGTWAEDTIVPTPPILKRYQLDTTSFEGYIGSNYSEKNIELILTDEKQYKRKTNFDLNFWD